MNSQWLPPAGSTTGPVAPPPAADAGSSTRAVVVGVAAIMLGVAAIAVQNAYKLDAERILSGGAYLKDGYRTMLLTTGVLLVALGLLLAVIGATSTASRRLRRGIAAATIITAAVTSIVLVLTIIGVRSAEGDHSTGISIGERPAVGDDAAPSREASGDGSRA